MVKWFKNKPLDPEVEAAYDKAYKEERIKYAQEKARVDAHKPTHQPFFRRLGDVAVNIGKDIGQIRLSDQFYEEANIFNPAPKPKRNGKRRR
jgi:hypothetical protein